MTKLQSLLNIYHPIVVSVIRSFYAVPLKTIIEKLTAKKQFLQHKWCDMTCIVIYY